MIIIGLLLLLEPTFATQRDDVVLNCELEVFTLHSWKLCLEDYVVFVLVDVDTGVPGSPADTFLAKTCRQIRGKQAVHLFLQRAQVTERVITNDTHLNSSSSLIQTL